MIEAITIFEQHIPNRGFLPWGKVSPYKAVQGHLEVFHGEPKGAGDQVDAEFFHLIEGEGVDFLTILIGKICAANAPAISLVAFLSSSLWYI